MTEMHYLCLTFLALVHRSTIANPNENVLWMVSGLKTANFCLNPFASFSHYAASFEFTFPHYLTIRFLITEAVSITSLITGIDMIELRLGDLRAGR
jgi:hypothetical protein